MGSDDFTDMLEDEKSFEVKNDTLNAVASSLSNRYTFVEQADYGEIPDAEFIVISTKPD